MELILRRLKRYSFFILFSSLLFIFLNVFLQFNRYQQSIFLENMVELRGEINTFFSYFVDFFYLKVENKRLLEENTYLKNLLPNTYERVPAQALYKQDTLFFNGQPYFRKYYLYGAKVIANRISSVNNTFQILSGQNHRITKDMGVLTKEGVVGLVTNVSANYAEVLSILNMSYKISAVHKKSHFVGLVEWDGKNDREVLMQHLPYTANVHIGDTIYTSQYSEKFLPYSVIGTVSQVEKHSSKNSYNIRIHLSADLREVTYVYVIENLLHEDKQHLEARSNFYLPE